MSIYAYIKLRIKNTLPEKIIFWPANVSKMGYSVRHSWEPDIVI